MQIIASIVLGSGNKSSLVLMLLNIKLFTVIEAVSVLTYTPTDETRARVEGIP